MLRFFAGAASALMLVLAGFFIWKSRAETESLVPPAPPVSQAPMPSLLAPQQKPEQPPAASEKTREEKRFARADKDDDGRITRDELMQPRRKAFAKLDTNGDGRLGFEEWAITTGKKFAGADADGNGSLTPQEYETTKPKTRPKKKCSC